MTEDNQTREKSTLFAGLSFKTMRSMLDGTQSPEITNASQSAHKLSFLFHFRPRFYPKPALVFRHTYYLGFFLVLLFILELVSGLFLMLYYVPTPDGAYQSIRRIITEVPFGELIRDTHRLCGELIVIFSTLHLLRVFLTGSFTGQRRMTWVTGIFLLIGMLGLAFTGYLLPWDQLAYWAVTIGTSMAEAVPLVGKQVNLLLRGAEDIGADGLLRFYLLHIAVLPIAVFVILGFHYYRVSRLHGISLPVPKSRATRKAASHSKINYLPGVFLQEVFLIGISLLLILIVAQFFYDAPLENHADPSHTPWNAQAPWYFLWLQGLLKIGDKTVMGVFIPLFFLTAVGLFPYYCNRRPFRVLQERGPAVSLLVVLFVALGILSYFGTKYYGMNLPAQLSLVNEFAPAEGSGVVHRLPYDQLHVGIYYTHKKNAEKPPEIVASLLTELRERLEQYEDEQVFTDASAIVMIEEWQADLKRVTLRVQWLDHSLKDDLRVKSIQQIVHLHKNRT